MINPNRMEYVVDGVVPALLAIVIIFIIFKLCKRRKARVNTGFAPLKKNENNFVAVFKTYSYDELAKVTADFSQNNFLGEGAFDFVCKGVLSNREFIAIKQFKSKHIQGKNEFRIEIDVIKSIHHTLVGYYCLDTQNMLVYEFVPNKTLEFHLHGENTPTMDLSKRMKIALGLANGLHYLHEYCHPKIIHRDIKAANILLDDDFEAKVADFGLAKFLTDDDSYVSTGVKGTFGYLDPEYGTNRKLTEKLDVYSFGVVLLELITGQTPIISTTKESLVQWARPKLIEALKEGNQTELVDPRLDMTSYNRDQMIIMIACAGKCVSKLGKHRPQMSQIVRALEANISLDNLNVGSTSGEYDDVMKAHFNMILKLDQEASQEKRTNVYYSWPNEQGISEYCSWSSSEHDQHPSASISSGYQNTTTKNHVIW